MQSGQVSIWVPILVGLIGVLGVVLGQLVTAWRERSREASASRRADDIYWRDKRLEASLALLVTMNAWRELVVDTWCDSPDDAILADLHDTVIAMSDQLATLKLIGTDSIRTAATTAVDDLFATSAAVRAAPTTADHPQASRHLSATIHTLREHLRHSLSIP
ncbi:hypothetical protein [Kutzneria sp. CA-103260]|uniref:hypothetical protein n=1 Tax=Kutzneria sp. CA-103260 TaxID=2802641 RepID=UPI001BAC916D|nr:hypothetical protein [Kutzneria sp. CA-103260]QUQ69749.1 hypothetical protein JJ691_75110 [Kutzneria sp. CA-103260]